MGGNQLEERNKHKRMLAILKEIEADPNNLVLIRKHIRAIMIEMDAEDVAYVEKLMSQ